MLPITDYVDDGETIYLAVHAKYADRLIDIGADILATVSKLQDFRLLVMVFSNRLELLHLCDSTTVDDLRDVLAIRQEWQQGNALGPVIGVMLADHAAVRERDIPTLFLVSDGDVACYWHPTTLSLLMKIVWLHEPTTIPVATLFGEHRVVTFGNALQDETGPDNHPPQQDGQDKH